MKALWNKQEKLNDDLADFREHVARDYPSRDSVEKRLDKIDSKLDRLIEQRAND